MKSYFSKLLITVLSLIVLINISIPAYAEEPAGSPFNKIVFFGDSLSDNGNLYWADWGFLPKSPPYFEGHFSNGDVWSEYVAQYYQDKNAVTTSNYAIGGLTALFHNPIKGFLPYSLTFAYDTYLVKSVFRDRSHTLFVLWIGANDYLPGTDKPDELSDKVIANIKYVLEGLIYHGGQNFLVLNLPDLSATPFAQTSGTSEYLKSVTNLHNTKLAAAIADIQTSYKGVNVHLYDTNALFGQLLSDPAYFNTKYATHITNTSASCWKGGYSLAQAKRNIANIARQLDQQVNVRSKLMSMSATSGGNSSPITPVKNLDTTAFAEYIAQTPSLLETYNVGDSGKLCTDPDDYVFWDHIHPTGVVHKMLSQNVIDYIETNYSTPVTK